MTDTTTIETKVLQEVLETLEMHAHNAGTVIHAKLAYDKLNRVLNGKPATFPSWEVIRAAEIIKQWAKENNLTEYSVFGIGPVVDAPVMEPVGWLDETKQQVFVCCDALGHIPVSFTYNVVQPLSWTPFLFKEKT